jgi:transketolase
MIKSNNNLINNKMAKVKEILDEEIDITEEETEQNESQYEKKWNKLIPKIIKAYPQFTKEELKHIEGSEHKRWALMMKKTGLSSDNLEKFLNSLEQ